MNLGKQYPGNNRPDFAIETQHPFSRPPRRWRYSSTHVQAIGTLAVPWLDQALLSTEYTLEENGQELWWQFDHPSVTDNFIRMIWKLREKSSGSPRYEIVIVDEFWFEGLMYGDNETLYGASDVFLGSQALNHRSISWQHRISTLLFHTINQSSFFACRWQDDDYQPYHTNPF